MTQLYGQMSPKSKNQISEKADYLQIAVSGKSPKEVLDNLEKLDSDLPVFLHADWAHDGKRWRNNTIFDEERVKEYLEMIKQIPNVIGITIHSPLRSFMRKERKTLEDLADVLIDIEQEAGTFVSIEHRSNKEYAISTPEDIEIISSYVPITLDIPALFCTFNRLKDIEIMNKELRKTVHRFNNILELHLGDSSLFKKRYVGVTIGEGDIDYKNLSLPSAKYVTLEVLGGKNSFESSLNSLTSSLVRT